MLSIGGHVLLLADGNELAYQVMRCLTHCGLTVHVVGTRESSAARLGKSKFCSSIDLINRTHLGTGEALEVVIATARRYGAGPVVPSDPETVRFLVLHGNQLECGHFPVTDGPLFERLLAKDSFADLCAEFLLPHPPTYVVNNGKEALHLLDNGLQGRTVVIKPTGLSGGAGVWVFHPGSPKDRARLAYVRHSPVLVQFFQSGTDVFVSLSCDSGRIVTCVAYEVWDDRYDVICDPKLDELLEKVASLLNLHGLLGFDFRRDAQGSYTFIECNPRPTFNGLLISLLSGVNLVEDFLRPMTVRRIPAAFSIRRAKLLRPWSLVHAHPQHRAYLLSDLNYNIRLALSHFVRAKVVRSRSVDTVDSRQL